MIVEWRRLGNQDVNEGQKEDSKWQGSMMLEMSETETKELTRDWEQVYINFGDISF